MPNFFTAKYMFAIVPINRTVHNKKKLKESYIHMHIKTRPPITWLLVIMKQTLKSTQVNCSSQCLLE